MARDRHWPAFTRVLSGLIALLTLAAGSCQKDASPTDAARSFFQLIASGKISQAYAQSAFGFQAAQNEKAFEATVRDLGLAEYHSLALNSETPEFHGDNAALHLEISTRSGKRIPLLVTMLRESGAWRVFDIRSPRDPQTGIAENHFTVVGKAATFGGGFAKDPPDEQEVRRLVRDNLLQFDKAIEDKSFQQFYKTLSAKWRDQLTEGQLERAFQPFIDHQFRISGVEHTQAIFDHPPALDSAGMLVVAGYYPTKPFKTVFSLKFTFELPKWKLFGIDVNLQK